MSNEEEVINIFNNYHINIVEISSGEKPMSKVDEMLPGETFNNVLDKIIESYKNQKYKSDKEDKVKHGYFLFHKSERRGNL